MSITIRSPSRSSSLDDAWRMRSCERDMLLYKRNTPDSHSAMCIFCDTSLQCSYLQSQAPAPMVNLVPISYTHATLTFTPTSADGAYFTDAASKHETLDLRMRVNCSALSFGDVGTSWAIARSALFSIHSGSMVLEVADLSALCTERTSWRLSTEREENMTNFWRSVLMKIERWSVCSVRVTRGQYNHRSLSIHPRQRAVQPTVTSWHHETMKVTTWH